MAGPSVTAGALGGGRPGLGRLAVRRPAGGLLLAALANSAQGGALVMAGFAVGSAPALAAAPWMWQRWRALRGSTATPTEVAMLGFRVAGVGLVLGSGWALTHGLWDRFAAWCMS